MNPMASVPAFISGSDAYSPAEMRRNSTFQLPQKSRQIPKLSDRLKFSYGCSPTVRKGVDTESTFSPTVGLQP
jgi:hypothetical protein